MYHNKCYFILVFLFVQLTIPVMAQTASDIIHLKNGSIIKGTITEEVMGQGVKLETTEGNLFVFKMEEIEKITKDPVAVGQSTSEIVYMKNGSIIKGTVTEQVVGKNIKIQTRDGNILVYNIEDVEKITKEPVVTAPKQIQQTEKINQVETKMETESVNLQPPAGSDRKGLRLGVYAGLTSFTATTKSEKPITNTYMNPNYPYNLITDTTGFSSDETTSNSKTGFAIGGYLDFSTSKIISIQAGIEYSQKGGEDEETVLSSTTKTSFDYSYFNIPLTLSASIPITDSKLTPFAFVGGSAGFLTAASTTTTFTYSGGGGEDEGPGQEIKKDIKSSSESINLSVLLGAGVEYQVSEMIAITGQFRYSVGLSNMLKDTSGNQKSIKSSGFYALVGAKFSL